jgi:hypothetical protein
MGRMEYSSNLTMPKRQFVRRAISWQFEIGYFSQNNKKLFS